MTLELICLALVAAIPVSLFVVLKHVKETQVINGQPVHILEKRLEAVAIQQKEENERRAYISDTMKKRVENMLG